MATLVLPVLSHCEDAVSAACRIVHRGGADGEWTCATCEVSFGRSLRLALAHKEGAGR